MAPWDAILLQREQHLDAVQAMIGSTSRGSKQAFHACRDEGAGALDAPGSTSCCARTLSLVAPANNAICSSACGHRSGVRRRYAAPHWRKVSACVKSSHLIVGHGGVVARSTGC